MDTNNSKIPEVERYLLYHAIVEWLYDVILQSINEEVKYHEIDKKEQ